KAPFLQAFTDLPHFAVDTGNHPIVSLHHALILFRRIKTPIPPSAVESLFDHRRKPFEVEILPQRRSVDHLVLIKVVVFRLPEVLALRRIVPVWCAEADRETERLLT